MYVVAESNQASGRCERVAVDDLFTDFDDALAVAADLTADERKRGGRNRYYVAALGASHDWTEATQYGGGP